jgi:hypothetical protein
VKGSATVRGPNGYRSNGSEIEGQPDPRLKTEVPDGGRTGMPDGGRTGCQTGCPTGWPDGGARRGARRGQTGCPTGPDGCHVNASLTLRRPYCVVTGGSVTSRRVTTSHHRHKVTIDNIATDWAKKGIRRLHAKMPRLYPTPVE